jgi:hypothetical protein
MRTVESTYGGVTIIENILEDSDYTTSEVKANRLGICKVCEFYSIDDEQLIGKESCSKCSCILEHRTSFVDLFCPEGKW